MRKLILMLAMAVLCAGMTGCATISSGSDTYTQFSALPEQVECTVEGSNYKQVITTPANVTLPAKAAPVTIKCTADGYHQGVQTIDTKMDGTILGNILLGGGIGLIVDACTKAGQKYPEKVTMKLNKKEFFSQDECDKWYETAKKDVKEKADREVQLIIAGCKDDDRTMCERKVKQLNEHTDEKIALLNKHHSESVIIESVNSQQADS